MMDRKNLDYIEDLFQQYKQNPKAVHPDWKLFFDGVELASELDKGTFSKKEIKVYELIHAYREDGHLKANLNPLKIPPSDHPFFHLSRFDLGESDKGKKFETFSLLQKDFLSLNEMIQFLEKTYCSTLALHVGGCSPEIRYWFFRQLEQTEWTLTIQQKRQYLKKLMQVEAFEKFIHQRFIGAKRFSIEGSDSLMVMLDHLVEMGVNQGVEEIIIGMPHRGRLNVMANFMNQPVDMILSQFEREVFSDMDFTGDVKYHIGYSSKKKTNSGKDCKLLLGFNPSHLESIAPVVCGVTRARQRLNKDTDERKKSVPVLIHGDASFCGQGVVSETLQLSQLKGYTVGGSIHIIVNNQIGFTTDATDGRSSPYASDLAQSIQAPILLVNADDPENCARAMELALQFRMEFQKDVIIDLISYRRYGHNEGDEPAFTQPMMYQKIKDHLSVATIYKEKLIKEGSFQEAIHKDHSHYQENLQKVLDRIRKTPMTVTEKQLRGDLWPFSPKPSLDQIEEEVNTCPKEDSFHKVLDAITKKPDNFHLHPKLERLIQNRKKMAESNQLDWALAELLAYGTLCLEGHSVRFSGQDSKRGTFSHRHACYFDTKNGNEYIPLTHLDPKQGEFVIYNSPLSEMAVLGFEYGNSYCDHSNLTIWEAQFGDFSNGAQVMIDQYISSGEEKWLQSCALTLFLPHGYEGQGPEHSSARLERYLQLCAQNNMQVAYPTSPANLFHLIRRQLKREFYKPLVVMTPKSLLRHPQVVSKKEDFLQNSFQEVIGDIPKDTKQIRTLILCTGKIYFELKKTSLADHILLVRLEQLYPFPKSSLSPYLNGFINLEKVIWLQEEPKNMGAFLFVSSFLRPLMDELGRSRIPIEYVGREKKASPASGAFQIYQQEQNQLIKDCLSKANQ